MDLEQGARDLLRLSFDTELGPQILNTLLASGFTVHDLEISDDAFARLTEAPGFDYASNSELPQWQNHIACLALGLRKDPGRGGLVVDELRQMSNPNISFNMKCLVLKTHVLANVNVREEGIFENLRDLTDSWWSGEVSGEPSTSGNYSAALFAQAFAEVYLRVQQHRLRVPKRWKDLMEQHAPVVLVQIVSRIIVHANDKESSEDKAYNLYILSRLQAFDFLDFLGDEIEEASEKRMSEITGMAYCTDLSMLAMAHIFAALKSKPAERPSLSAQDKEESKKKMAKLTQFGQFFAAADFMKGEPLVSIKASILEASFYTEMLRSKRNNIFPPTLAPEKNGYLDYIPLMFTFQSTYSERCLPPQWLFDIMQWIMLIFLVDEYMEANVVGFPPNEMEQFKAELEKIHPNPDPRHSVIKARQLPSLDSVGRAKVVPKTSARVQDAVSVFFTWAMWVMHWDRLADATGTDMNDLRSEIKNYLLFHVHQIEDNIRFAEQQSRLPTERCSGSSMEKFLSPRTSYPRWQHTVGGGHASAPISLAFASCYMGSWVRKGKNAWSSIFQHMLAYETNIHVAAYLRMYNDYASVPRDADECNLNSVNFPEFWDELKDVAVEDRDQTLMRTKASLLELAHHEKAMADLIGTKFFASLSAEATKEGDLIAACMRTYFRAGECFSDLYLSRDITNRVK